MQKTQELKEILQKIPKTEIHLHLEGIASVDSIWTLMQKNKVEVPGVSIKEDLVPLFQVKSLKDFIWLFINVIQNCFQSHEDIEHLIIDAQNYLKSNNIVYAEIFFAPSKFLMNGISFESIVKKLDSGAKQIKEQEGIDIRFLIDVSRSFGVKNAEKNLNLVLANKSSHIIGIGLGGEENGGPARDYQSVFDKAIGENLKVVAHAGEVVGPESIWDAINYLKASRIGHGISAIQDEKLMDHLAAAQTPLEICPTSNLYTRKYVKKIEDHPIRPFYDRGVFVTVNTDDPSIFGIDLIDEYMNLVDHNLFEPKEIFGLIRNNIYATFLASIEKEKIWEKAEDIIKSSPFS